MNPIPTLPQLKRAIRIERRRVRQLETTLDMMDPVQPMTSEDRAQADRFLVLMTIVAVLVPVVMILTHYFLNL